MSLEAKIDTLQRSVKKYFSSKQKQENEVWVDPIEARNITGWSPDTLRHKYYQGIIKHRRTTNTGRKPRYLKKELESLLING